MIKLMKLELQRINLRTYFINTIIFCVVLIVFTYFVAFVAQVEKETEFMTYENIFRFTSAISIILFAILSATMYSRIIIEEYSGKKLALLFSYPNSRKKIFIAKVLVVSGFILLSMLLCTVIPTIIFTITECFVPIVSDTITSNTLIAVFKIIVISLIAVNAIGLLAMRIGFFKKSVPVTLVSAFILSGLYGNIAISLSENFRLSMLVISVSLSTILLVIITFSHKLNHMEVE